MSPRREIRARGLPVSAAPLSHAIAAGQFIFLSGQVPHDPETKVVPKGIEAQTHQVLKNIEAVLAAAGCDLDDVVKVTAHLADLAERPGFNTAYRQHFRPPYPARTTVGSELEGVLLEVDVVAFKSGDAKE